MSKFKPYNVDQLMLLPPSLHDYVPQDHLARLVHKVVEQLDTTSIENKYSELGQNTYHPKILTKLLFYGYSVGERSGRLIAKKCESDTAYMYLAQMYKPDFRTINDFRKNNIKEISQYFVDIVRMCKELGLINVGQINIDSTKIRANASDKMSKTRKEYDEWTKKINKKVDDILREADDVDAKEDVLYGDKRGDELPEEINTEEKLNKRLREISKRFKGDDADEKINSTDPDARFMKTSGRIGMSYNCHAAVTENQIIVNSAISLDANDKSGFKSVVEGTEKILEEDIKEIAADAGYSSFDNYEYLEKNGKVGYIPDGRNIIKKDPGGGYGREKFMYQETSDTYICPEGKKLTLFKTRNRRYGDRRSMVKTYKGKKCSECMKRELCTIQEQRTVEREDRQGLRDRMRARLETAAGREKYLKRMCTIEPVFGHLKHNLGYRYFLLRTVEKVKAEFRLMCIGSNLAKMNRLLPIMS